MMYLFPATAALLMNERTWTGPVAISNWLRNYGKGGHSEGSPFWVNDKNHPGTPARFRFQYVNGIWQVTQE